MNRPILDVIKRLPIASVDAWVLWKYMAGRGGKLRKQPVGLHSPSVALGAWQKHGWSLDAVAQMLRDLWRRDAGSNQWGLGFNFHVAHPYVGLDWDPPIDGRWGMLHTTTYTEPSPSGSGLHSLVVLDGDKPKSRKFKTHPWSSVEVFSRTGFMTVTGHGGEPRSFRTMTASELADAIGEPKITNSESPVDGFDVNGRRGKENITEDDVFERLTDDEVLLRAASAANGVKFLALWRGDLSAHGGNHSEADLALCSILLYWTRRDREQADRLFRKSNLTREKWTERKDYRDRTFDRAEATLMKPVAEQLKDPTLAHKETLKAKERLTREVRREVDAEERRIVEPPACLTLTERLAQPQTEIGWRIEGWMPIDSRVMAAAQFKAGKTTLVQNAIRSLVDGDPFLGQFKVEPLVRAGMCDARLALLDFEMSERQLLSWFRDQRIKNTDSVVVVPMRGAAASFDIRADHVRARWAKQLRAQHVRLLILDCLRPIMDALGLNEHSEAGLLLTALDGLLNDAGITEAIVVHHMGHNGERARGDSRLRDWPDVEWRLVRQEENPASERFLSAFGRDVDMRESGLAIDVKTRQLTLEGGSRKEAKAKAALPAVLEVVRKAGEPLSKDRIEKAATADGNHKRDAVRAAIQLAVRDGVLIADQGGPGGAVRYSVHAAEEKAPVVSADPSDQRDTEGR